MSPPGHPWQPSGPTGSSEPHEGLHCLLVVQPLLRFLCFLLLCSQSHSKYASCLPALGQGVAPSHGVASGQVNPEA